MQGTCGMQERERLQNMGEGLKGKNSYLSSQKVNKSKMKINKSLYMNVIFNHRSKFKRKQLYSSAIKKNIFESVLMRWMKLEPIIQSEVSQKEKHQYSMLMHIYGIQKYGNDYPMCKRAKETDVYNSLLDSVGEGEGGMI